MSLPLPALKPYFPPLGRYYRYMVDTSDVPPVQEGYIEGVGQATIFTPTFVKLWVYGREIGSPYDEDQEGLERLRSRGRIMGEWFSVECPDGEGGSVPFDALTEISQEEFSAAFQRGWGDATQ